MILGLVGVVWAGPSEEVVVYGDAFGRWDHTRWWVQDEIVLPSSLVFAAENNLSFRTHALQVRAIVACEKDAKLSNKRWEVSCAIEDLGILTTTTDDWRPTAHPRVQTVLDQVDARLTGARVQLQVDDRGGITNFDLEGLTADNARERQIQESLRTVLSQVMAGFHLQIPEQAQRDGQWVESHTELMDIPSLTAARGSTMVVHEASDYNGDRLVQSVGHGTVAVAVVYTGTEAFHQSKLIQSDGSDSALGTVTPALKTTAIVPASPRVVFPPPERDTPTESSFSTVPRAGEQRETALEATWATRLSGVALFQRGTGMMTERVWVCTGSPTAGSPAGTGPYLNLGRLHILGPTESPSVGPSQQVAWPGQEMDGLDPWVELAAE